MIGRSTGITNNPITVTDDRHLPKGINKDYLPSKPAQTAQPDIPTNRRRTDTDLTKVDTLDNKGKCTISNHTNNSKVPNHITN